MTTRAAGPAARPTLEGRIEGRQRVVISGVRPEIDGGRFAIKRVVGETVVVEADLFAEGHDLIAAALLYRAEDEPTWREAPMAPLVNDRWRGEFAVTGLGLYRYTLVAWVDAFASWRRGLGRKLEAGQEIGVDLLIGAGLVEAAAGRASGADADALTAVAERVRAGATTNPEAAAALILDEALAARVRQAPDRAFATTYPRELLVRVDPVRARFSTWYELFPRSCSPTPGRHGTFRDVEARLPYVAELGFDVLYLPPIHPIGRTFRKGANNAVVAREGEPGSPWGIGAAEGGHTAVHPELGTLAEFEHLVRTAREYGIDIALDLALQCSPDHPYATEHPEWFRHRPDGSIQYAENPPKKYQDIYPIDFDTPAWPALWQELRGILFFWIERGVRIFRVDNPHTKPYVFWEWVIAEVKAQHPEVLFLSEAFTRPKVMAHLAKLGFSQSYTYFAWRNTKWDLTEYLTELTRTDLQEYFRPNFWPNTPDILTEYLQHGGRPAFMARLVLAATMTASYGIYGPAFELCEHVAREPGSEEYLNSEKYEIRHWDLDRPDSLRHFIARVNRVRHEHPALQENASVRFHGIDNDAMIAYSKRTPDNRDVILTIVSLDPYHARSGWTDLALADLGLEPDQSYQMHDLLDDSYYEWHGGRNFVLIDPARCPAHVFQVRRRVRSERDFDYYQ